MFSLLIDYIEKKISLLKLEVKEKVVLSAGNLAFLTCFIIALVFFVIMVNIGLALWIGQKIHNISFGFFIVAAIYLLFLIIISIFRKSIKRLVANFILKSFEE